MLLLLKQIFFYFMRYKYFLIIACFLSFLFSESTAEENDLCTRIIKKTEIDLNIPENLLLSIALTESGRKIGKNFFPWPWSINVKGKGYFLKNKQELISHARANLKKKIKNFDLGCMQINYYYHGHKFKNIAEMVEPESNVLWAGKFLISLKNSHKTWNEAISRYHSNTKWRKRQYLAKVMNNWTFVGKIKDLALQSSPRKNNKENKKNSNLSKTKEDQKIKLTEQTQPNESKKIFEEIEDGRKRVKNENRISKNNFYSRFIEENNLGKKFKNIMEKEGFDKIIIEISDLLPENIDNVQVINEFKYLEKSLIKDNLERIDDYKKKK